MFGHDICLKGRLYTVLIFSAFKIHNSVSLWVKITRKPSNLGRPSLCFARKQSSNIATGCDVINRWIIGTRNFAKSWPPPCWNPMTTGLYYVNIDLRHQYRISVAESQTFLSAKRPQRRRARRNGCFRSLKSRGGHFRNFWVGMCRWDPGTLNLYQS